MRHAPALFAVVAAHFLAFTGILQASSPFVHQPAPCLPHSPAMPPFYRMSTAYGDALLGGAAVIGARGNYEVMVAHARILEEHRRHLALQNHLDKTFVALERRRMLAEQSDYERLRRLERQAEAAEILRDRELELATKYQLARHEVDPTTGAIYWPAWIAGPRYAAHRQEIEQLMDQIVRYGYVTNQNFLDHLTQACNAFRQQLQAELREELTSGDAVDQYVRNEYARADRFLKGVRYTPLVLATERMEMLSMK